MDLNTFLNKEVYILGPESIGGEIGELKAFGSMTEILAHLLGLEVATDTEMKDQKVLHGYMTSADVLPSSFNDKQAFLIVQEPYDDTNGVIIESTSDDSEGLAYEIEQLLENPELNIDGGTDMSDVEIDSISILYGYEISIRFALDLDEIQEKVVEGCKKIVAEVKQIKERNSAILAED